MSKVTKKIALALRIGFIPAVWLAYIPYAIAAGKDPGFVPLRYSRPYPVGHVISTILLLAVESVFIFAMLRPASYRVQEWRPPLKALGIVLLAFFFEPMVTDMPGYMYVNSAFLFTWFVILALLAVSGIVASWIFGRVQDREHAA